nr:condensation domain-containing protein [Nocardia nova]
MGINRFNNDHCSSVGSDPVMIGLPPLEARVRPAVVPLSFAQLRVWFIDQFEGPSPIYNMAAAWRLRGQLDVDALATAVADVVGRHESLRTVFAATQGVPRQVIIPAAVADVGWEVVDATGWRASRLQEAVGAAAQYTFDLATEIPLRAKLFTVAGEEHVLVVTVHHIAADGRSLPPLVADLGTAYSSRCAGRDPRWPGLPVQYADYTLWQRENYGDLTDSHSLLAAQLAYWEHKLAAIPERPSFPTDRPYPPVADYRAGTVTVNWPATLHRHLRDVARDYNATTSMMVQAALVVLMSQVSASHDVVLGIATIGRIDPALNELVGMFVNVSVLRAEVMGDPTFIDVLTQVRQHSAKALERQDVPFEVLVDRLNPLRTRAHHPLVQVLFAWENFAWQYIDDQSARPALGDVEATAVSISTGAVCIELQFSLGERWTDTREPAGIGGVVEFRNDIFEAVSIEAVVERLQRILEAVTADPLRRLSSIDVLDEDEHARVDGWGNRAVLTRPMPPRVSIPALFASQVTCSPTAVALSCEGRWWTYREVDEVANQLAHLLAGHGVGAGDVVGLLFERSAQAIIAILAVLKTGAAYLPIDPAYPDTRIGFLIGDARPVAALTTDRLRSRLDGYELVVIDVDDPAIAAHPAEPLPDPSPDNIAYIIYTSGTTGLPKGVAITHHNTTQLISSLYSAVPAMGVWAQWHSYAFDGSVQEIWGALLGVGGWWWCPTRWPARRKTCTPC